MIPEMKLYYAITTANFEAVKEVLEENPDIDLENLPKGDSTYFAMKDRRALAIALSNTMVTDDFIALLIDAGADVNSIVEDKQMTEGSTYLIQVCSGSNINRIRMLLEAGADVNAENRLGKTALDEIVYGGDTLSESEKENRLSKIKLLLDYGAKFRKETLEVCIESQTYSMAKYVLQQLEQSNIETGLNSVQTDVIKGNDKEAQEEIQKWSSVQEKDENLIFFASANCSAETLKLMKEKGFSLNKRDDMGNLPIHIAVRYNQLDAVRYLAGQTDDINAETNLFMEEDSSGNNALTFAVARGKTEIAQYLLEQGGKWQNNEEISTWITACEDGNKSSLQFLMKHNYQPTKEEIIYGYGYANEETLDYLLEQKIPFQLEYEGETPLSLLCMNHLSLGEKLYEKGAKPDWQSIYRAIEEHDVDFAKKMIHDYEKIDSQDGLYLLEEAVILGQLDIVKCIVENGIDLNRMMEDEDGYQYTILHVAAQSLSKNILQYLLEAGADPTKKDSEGNTPRM